MKRYQVYLNPQSVATIDSFEKETELSRSGVIRMVVDAVAVNLQKTLIQKKRGVSKRSLKSIIGVIKPKTNQITHSAETVDDIYRV